MKFAGLISALNPQWFILLTLLRRGPGVSLTFCCFVVYSTKHFFYVLPCLCYFVLVFFNSFSITITSFGGRES